MSMPRETRYPALISVVSIILACIALLGLRAVHPSWLSNQFNALMLSLVLCVCACLLLFARRFGQAHMALGVYLLAIGGATVILPRLLLADYGQNDLDILFLLSGPLYLFVGTVLVVISLLNHGHWMKRMRTMWMRTVLLTGPGTILIILCPVLLGPRMWDVPPYGFDLVAAGWVIGIGIFCAGSRFAKTIQPDSHQGSFSGSTQ
jgi:hypothetical protein